MQNFADALSVQGWDAKVTEGWGTTWNDPSYPHPLLAISPASCIQPKPSSGFRVRVLGRA